MTHIRIVTAAMLVSSLTLVGCGGGGGGGNSARVSGALTYKGQPIKAAVMYFHDSQGVAYEAKVGTDGTYSAADIPVGELVATVNTEALNPGKTGAPSGPQADARMKQAQAVSRRPDAPSGGAAAPPPSSYYVKIPAKYAKPNTSTASITTKPGRQVINIDLTD